MYFIHSRWYIKRLHFYLANRIHDKEKCVQFWMYAWFKKAAEKSSIIRELLK